MDIGHFPLAPGHLVDQLPVIIVPVQMAVSVAVRQPEELATLLGEEEKFLDALEKVEYVYPVLGGFLHDQPALTAVGIEEKQAKLALVAGEVDYGEGALIGGPVNSGDVAVGRHAGVKPGTFAGDHIHYADANRRVGVAHLGITDLYVFAVLTFIIGHLKDGNLRLVFLPEGDVASVGRPFPGLGDHEFFFVDPAGATVEYVFGSIVGEADGLVGGEFVYIKVALAFKSDPSAVRGKFGGTGVTGYQLQGAGTA